MKLDRLNEINLNVSLIISKVISKSDSNIESRSNFLFNFWPNNRVKSTGITFS